MAPRLLLVEDEDDLAGFLTLVLELAGYKICHRATLRDAKQYLLSDQVDLVLLDRLLPDGNGIELCRWLRNRDYQTKILLLTAMSAEGDIVSGLESGADDYMCKPFSGKVLLAKISVLLRRCPPQENKILRCGAIELDRSRAAVKVAGNNLNLTNVEFNLLESLMKANGQVLSRSQLLDTSHEEQIFVSPRTIDVHIVALRRKIGLGNLIETVRGFGYRLNVD